MIGIEKVPAHDWITLAVGVTGALTTYMSQKNRLPRWARKWLKRIGTNRIADAIERAGAIAELSPDERRQQAVIYLQKLCVAELGFPVPQSIANLLVEHIYQQWKRARR
ncbi:MAG: hypothetical protein ACOX3G_05285 [Armatimonadota bacterium]|jgi:hypothetical protein